MSAHPGPCLPLPDTSVGRVFRGQLNCLDVVAQVRQRLDNTEYGDGCAAMRLTTSVHPGAVSQVDRCFPLSNRAPFPFPIPFPFSICSPSRPPPVTRPTTVTRRCASACMSQSAIDRRSRSTPRSVGNYFIEIEIGTAATGASAPPQSVCAALTGGASTLLRELGPAIVGGGQP